MKISSLVLCLPLLLALPKASFGQAAPQVGSGVPVATVGGQPITEEELLDTLGPQQAMQLRTQEYEAKSKALDSLIRLKLVQAEAKKRGIPAEKLIEQEVESKVPDPTDGEVEAYFWGQNRAGATLEQVKEEYRASLKQLKLRKARQVYADSLRKKIERTLHELLAKYGGRVKLAYLDFPLRDIHPLAQSAAEAARCAGEQGKFWEYHDALYADQSKLDGAELLTRARALKLDEKSFQSCVSSGKFKSKIDADLEQGRKVGVAGTPGFFVNGVFLSGALPPADFEKVIDNELALLGAPHPSQ